MNAIFRRFLPLLLSVLLMTACAPGKPTLAGKPALIGNPELPYPPSRPPVVGDILHLPTGTFVSQPQMLGVATDARIAYVGETHDNPASHRLELAVLRAMAERWPGRVAVGMEMFTPAQQPILDRWVAGELSEKEFIRESHWYRVWRMDFDYYRDLLQFARDHRIPVIGLNAEKSLVKAVGEKPLSELSAKERAALPEMDFSDPYQKALVISIFGGHAHSGNLDAFLRVQTLWDETMAANVARYLQGHEGNHMVVLAGGNHIRFGFGIPRRVFRRLPTSYVLIGSREIEIPASMQDRLMNVEEPQFPMPPYDFLAYTRYEELARPEVRLGVSLEEREGGKVEIGGVAPGSVAEQFQLRKGDRILAVDGTPVNEAFDVVYAVRQKHPGDRMKLQLERDGRTMTVEVVFPPSEKKPAGS